MNMRNYTQVLCIFGNILPILWIYLDLFTEIICSILFILIVECIDEIIRILKFTQLYSNKLGEMAYSNSQNIQNHKNQA
jgi:hypothetical protein